MEIIIFAAVAAFLFFKFRDVLGRNVGRDEVDHPFDVAAVKEAQDKRKETTEAPKADIQEIDHEDPTTLGGLKAIQRRDPSFNPDEFLEGSRGAYEIVLDAFAAGNEGELQTLLSRQVFNDFKAAIDARQEAGETLETTLVGFESSEIVSAQLEDDIASVTVKYVTDQITVTKNAEDEAVAGDGGQVVEISDLWTFSRKVTSPDPNWTLVATEGVDDE